MSCRISWLLVACVFCVSACGDAESGEVDAQPVQADASSVDGAAMVADAQVDGALPVPDASPVLPACVGTLQGYPGTFVALEAQEGNPLNLLAHFLSLRGELNADATPDVLTLTAFYEQGVETGTFPLPAAQWAATLCVDLDVDAVIGNCSLLLEPISGTVTFTSVAGRLTGSFSELQFVDDRDNPTCGTSIAAASFDEAIVCIGPGDCS